MLSDTPHELIDSRALDDKHVMHLIFDRHGDDIVCVWNRLTREREGKEAAAAGGGGQVSS